MQKLLASECRYQIACLYCHLVLDSISGLAQLVIWQQQASMFLHFWWIRPDVLKKSSQFCVFAYLYSGEVRMICRLCLHSFLLSSCNVFYSLSALKSVLPRIESSCCFDGAILVLVSFRGLWIIWDCHIWNPLKTLCSPRISWTETRVICISGWRTLTIS